jgi:predicted nucleic acid-binding protein
LVVSNASPLIALEQIGQLQLIESIFSEILIPPAVAREVASSVVPRPWIATRELRQPVGR